MTFDEIRQKAISEWESLQNSDKPRILIGAGTCGRAAGAIGILEAIKKELTQQNTEAILIQVGCIGPCFAEPMI
jgi:NADH-quinone oxidoreductase subunit F